MPESSDGAFYHGQTSALNANALRCAVLAHVVPPTIFGWMPHPSARHIHVGWLSLTPVQPHARAALQMFVNSFLRHFVFSLQHRFRKKDTSQAIVLMLRRRL